MLHNLVWYILHWYLSGMLYFKVWNWRVCHTEDSRSANNQRKQVWGWKTESCACHYKQGSQSCSKTSRGWHRWWMPHQNAWRQVPVQLILQASYLQAVGITNVMMHLCFSVKASTSFALDKDDSASSSSSSFDEKDKDKDDIAPPKNKCECIVLGAQRKHLFVQQCK